MQNKLAMTHRFYKELGTWYIDLPAYLEAGLGTKANLMMVAGADIFLDQLSNHGTEVTVHMETAPYAEQSFALKKIGIGKDQELLDTVGHAPVEYGAYYKADRNGHILWLCPVTEYVFGGDYPDNIYIHVVSEHKPKTFYHIIADESGSMNDCVHQTVNGLFEQRSKIIELQEKFPEQEIRVGLTFFNSQVRTIFENLTVNQMAAQVIHNYRPNGNTALLDAIGQTIQQVERQMTSPQDSAVIIILTDGYENASRIFTLQQIRALITQKEASGRWTFSYLGATLDAVDMAEQMHIKRQNAMAFDKANMQKDVWNKLSDSMDHYLDKKRRGASLDELYDKK
jgi:von Willebrand factor type A domain